MAKHMLNLPSTNRLDTVTLLRRRLERTLAKSGGVDRRLPLGPPSIDLALGGGLAAHGIHEVLGTAAPAISSMIASQAGGPIAWILGRDRVRRPYPCGVDKKGLSARNLLFITPRRQDVLWAFEQALKSGAIRAVIAETATAPDFTESRRLQLAATTGATLGLLLPPDSDHHSSAAETRWRASPIPRPWTDAAPRYRLELLKNKWGSLMQWEVDWHGPTHRFHLAAASRNRSNPTPRARMAG